VRLSVQSIDRSSSDCIVVLHYVDSDVSTRHCMSVCPCTCMRVGVSRAQVQLVCCVNRPVRPSCLSLAY